MASNKGDQAFSMKNLPLVSIGVISCNRLHYLKATLESARRCIQYPRLQWIVVDNASSEPGLREYLSQLDWLDELILRDNRSPETEHATAMNELVSLSKGEVLLIWPEDVQFVVEGDWMIDCVEVLMKHSWVGSMGLNSLGHRTISRLWTWRRWHDLRAWLAEAKRYGTAFRRQRTLHSSRGAAFRTYGWTAEGVVGSGIPSLTRMEVWRKLGPWKIPGAEPGLVDSSGGAETDMLARFKESKLALQRVIPVLPVAADIVTDPVGTKAKVRGFRRYGFYMPPPQGLYYYYIHRFTDVRHLTSHGMPLSFESLVKPLGYLLPYDSMGNLLKTSINKDIVVDLPM